MYTVILTGGGSRRMGRDKAELPYGGGTMLQYLIDKYSPSGPVLVSVDRPGRFEFRGAGEIADAYPGQGPLNGIVSAFSACPAQEIFLTATDLPLGEPELAARLMELGAGYDACLLRRGPKGIEPLFAVYGRACARAAEDCLAQGKKSFFDMLELVNVRYAAPEELAGFDIERMLTNINTEQDYIRLVNEW